MQFKHNLKMAIVVLLAFVQGALRTYYGLAASGTFYPEAKAQVMSMIDIPVSNEVLVIALPFLLLGVLGMIATVGLAMSTRWGAYGTLIVSVATIIYDVWASVAIQASAVFGMVVPVLLIAYVLMRRNELLDGAAVRA